MQASVLIYLLITAIQLFADDFKPTLSQQRPWHPNSIYESNGGNFQVKLVPTVDAAVGKLIPSQHDLSRTMNYQSNEAGFSNLSCPYHSELFSLYDFHNQDLYSTVQALVSDRPVHDPNYFADKLQYYTPQQQFHYFHHYQHPGFVKHVQKQSGFREFLDDLQERNLLSKDSELATRIKDPELRRKVMNQLQHLAQERQSQKRTIALTNEHLSPIAIQVLQQRGVVDQFLYHRSSPKQQNQFQQIVHHVNELASWKDLTSENARLVHEESYSFTFAANNANRNQMQNVSIALLEVAKDLFALSKGLVLGGIRNLTAIVNPQTYVDLGHLIGHVGASLFKTLYTIEKFQLALEIDDMQLFQEANREVQAGLNCIKSGWEKAPEIYQAVKLACHHAPRQQIYEATGGLIADAIFMMYGGQIISGLGKTMPVSKLAKYQPQVFEKLGQLGREIRQSTGALCAKGHKYLKNGEQFVAAGEAGLFAAEELSLVDEIKTGLNILKQDSQIQIAGAKAGNLAKIAEFEAGVAKLATTYGAETVRDAKEAINICKNKLLSKKSEILLNELEYTCKEIKIICENGKSNFLYELDQGEKISRRSISEALTACAAEDTGICEQLIRSTDVRYDFLDIAGNKWDIKEFNSSFINSFEFNFDKFAHKIKKEIELGEKVLLDITYAEKEHLKKLNNILDTLLSQEQKICLKTVIRPLKYRI